MKILVRLPNWLGDLVMSTAFLRQLPIRFPGAEIDVIIKKGIHTLSPFLPSISQTFAFEKSGRRSIKKQFEFGKFLASNKYDLFFSLPDSFSSALIGYASNARNRIGFKSDLRQFMLTHTFVKSRNKHRLENYLELIENFTGVPCQKPETQFSHSFSKNHKVVININSEASSRRLTEAKAVDFITSMRNRISNEIVLVGGPSEKDFVTAVYNKLPEQEGIINSAGNTSLAELVEILASASLMLTTDSGPAHLSNALGTPTVVLFGAGRESHTAPYNAQFADIVRLGELSCEPCEKNTCRRFDTPQCLERLHVGSIINLAVSKL